MDGRPLLIILVLVTSTLAGTLTVRAQGSNNTIELDLLSELGRAIKTESQSRPITSDSSTASRKTADIDSLLQLTRQINAEIGDNCSRDDWVEFVRPILEEYTNPTRYTNPTSKAKGNGIRLLKNEALRHNETLNGLCLSQSYLMECGVNSKCQCLTPADYGLDEEYVKCDAMGMPVMLSTFHVLAFLVSMYFL